MDNNAATPATMTAAPSSYMLGAALTLVAVFFFTSSHGIVRLLGGGLHPFEIALFSNVFSVVFYLPWLMRSGISAMRTQKLRVHVMRAIVNAGALITWYVALAIMPLADAVALALTGPLFLTAGAILILGEHVGIRRWVALMVGALGALIIIRPGFQEVSIGVAFVLGNATLGAGAKLFAKHLTKWDSAAVCGVYVALLQIPITLFCTLFVWQTPNLEQLFWLVAVGLMAGAAQLIMVQAYKYADVSAVEPLHYTRLIWAALIGYFVFSELPDIWTWVGGAVIVAATTYVARREAKARQRLLEAAPPVAE